MAFRSVWTSAECDRFGRCGGLHVNELVERESSCELEVDGYAKHVLNVNEVCREPLAEASCHTGPTLALQLARNWPAIAPPLPFNYPPIYPPPNQRPNHPPQSTPKYPSIKLCEASLTLPKSPFPKCHTPHCHTYPCLP